MKTTNTNDTRITIPCRISYAHVWEPKPEGEGVINGGFYCVCLLIDKKNTAVINKINAAVEAAKEAGKGRLKGARLRNMPLKDCDDYDNVEDEIGAEFKGKVWINAKSDRAPQIVDGNVDPILDRNEVYSGCYCNVSVNFYAYNKAGNSGIGCGLGNIQKVKDGERLAGGPTAKQEFDVISQEEEDAFLS